MSLNVVDAVSTTVKSLKPLCDDEIIHIMGYYPQTSFSLVSKRFYELRQIAVFFSCRKILASYEGRSPYIKESVCMIEDSYSLSRRIGDDNYQEANRIMLYVMKNIFHKLDLSKFDRKVITSTDNIEKFIEIENQALITLFRELKKQLCLLLFESDSRFNDPKMIRSWINDEENQIYLQEIRTLNVSWSKLTVIPQEIKNLKELSSFNLRGNQISDISSIAGLTTLTTLTYLTLEANQISDISPLAGLTALTQLILSKNQISDISPLTELTALTDLSLSQNQISDIGSLARLTALKILGLSWNKISDIGLLAELTALTKFYFVGNQISDISPLKGLIALTYLYLPCNQISDISPLAGLIALTHLDLSNNQINDISSLAGLIALTELRLEKNQINDFSPIANLPP